VFGFIADHKDVFKAAAVGDPGHGRLTTSLGLSTAHHGGSRPSRRVELTNPIGLIVAAVIGIGAALYYAYTHSETFRNFVDGLWTDLQNIAGWIRDHWSDISPWIVAPFEIAAQAISKIADGIVVAWNNTVGRLGGPKISADGSDQSGGEFPGPVRQLPARDRSHRRPGWRCRRLRRRQDQDAPGDGRHHGRALACRGWVSVARSC
jgi:hypothetical protein